MLNSKDTRSDQPEVSPRLDPCVFGVAPRGAFCRTTPRGAFCRTTPGRNQLIRWHQSASPASTGVCPQESPWCRSPTLAWSPPATRRLRSGPGSLTTAKVLALKATVLLLLTLLIKARVQIVAGSALGIALLLLQVLVFLAVSGGLVLAAGGAALVASQQRRPAAA